MCTIIITTKINEPKPGNISKENFADIKFSAHNFKIYQTFGRLSTFKSPLCFHPAHIYGSINTYFILGKNLQYFSSIINKFSQTANISTRETDI